MSSATKFVRRARRLSQIDVILIGAFLIVNVGGPLYLLFA